jgi:hypothetical protein
LALEVVHSLIHTVAGVAWGADQSGIGALLPVDVLPSCDGGGESFLATDHSQPSDGGHRAIALAFGGAIAR